MNQPTVCAVMLTADRPELAKRAVECFRAQTYQNAILLIMDTGTDKLNLTGYRLNEAHFVPHVKPAETIGELRNIINACAVALPSMKARPIDVFCHWDDDDYSHPNRIAEQVALLQASGADAVGYNEMLFWRKCLDHEMKCNQDDAQAWLFTGPTIIGTSLCYWRSAWEKRPFPAKSYGEDTEWLQGVKAKGTSSMRNYYDTPMKASARDPRMVARIHKGNTGHQSGTYSPKKMLDHPRQWKRVPEWDSYCKGVCE